MIIRSFASISSMRARRATALSVRSGRARGSSMAFAWITTVSSLIRVSVGVGSSHPETEVPAVAGVLTSVMGGSPRPVVERWTSTGTTASTWSWSNSSPGRVSNVAGDPFTYGPTTESEARAYYEVWAARPDTRNVKLDGPEGVLNPDA
jgi:hypothetical protein